MCDVERTRPDMDLNSTTDTPTPEINCDHAPSLAVILNATVSVLLSLQLDLVGVIYDHTAAHEVALLVPLLSRHAVRVVTYSAHDVINMQTTANYLDVMSGSSERSVSLVVSADVNVSVGVFHSVSMRQAQMGKQSGLDLYTKWLTPLPCGVMTSRIEEVTRDLYNVAAVVPRGGSDVRCNGTWFYLDVVTLIVKPEGKRFESIGDMRDDHLSLHTEVFPNARRGLNGQHFYVGLYVWFPFTMRGVEGNKTVYTGFCVDLVMELSRRLNFTYSFKEPADNEWGSVKSDGTFTGIVGMLEKLEIDISVAAFITTPERERVMEATFPFYYDNVGVLYRRPDPAENMWKTYLHPFHVKVLGFIGVSLLGGTLLYALLGILSPRDEKKRRGNYVMQFLAETNDEGGVLGAALIQHGLEELPAYGSRRFFLAFWWMFCIAVAATYRGNLMAFLLVAKEELPFTTLSELASQDTYTWGVTGSTVVEYLFNVSKRTDFRMLGEGLERFKAIDPDTNSLDPMVHYNKVQQGHYAYISDMVPMEIWVTKDCNLKLLKETVIPLPFVIGLQNNSAYVTTFNTHLLHIDQIGLYQVWKKKWWPRGGKCSISSQYGTKKVVSLREAQSAFFILGAGLGLAMLLLLAESLWASHRCRQARGSIMERLHTRTVQLDLPEVHDVRRRDDATTPPPVAQLCQASITAL
ncbi:glutamate receptor ionotropic, delta-2 [Aplysia californica]|uniref:Glutamate receptor ionotropic, delta-2 n=1 Tax=Aplysia californica TaxID=6500 RepID=A0ABM0ZWV5_APLCA|nr:glutamate receptor ionotropic, delta-2 [Aplysia californica]